MREEGQGFKIWVNRSQTVTGCTQLFDFREETDASRRPLRRRYELAKRGENRCDVCIVFADSLFELGELLLNRGICLSGIAKSSEGPDHMDAHVDGSRALQDHRQHRRAMLGEYIRRQAWISMALSTSRCAQLPQGGGARSLFAGPSG